jgi:TonB family protein
MRKIVAQLIPATIAFGALQQAPSARALVPLQSRQIMQLAVSTPQPRYPEQARLARVTGSGWFKLRVRRSSGVVRHVEITRSTGDSRLDAAATDALRRWRFKSGALPLDPELTS